MFVSIAQGDDTKGKVERRNAERGRREKRGMRTGERAMRKAERCRRTETDRRQREKGV